MFMFVKATLASFISLWHFYTQRDWKRKIGKQNLNNEEFHNMIFQTIEESELTENFITVTQNDWNDAKISIDWKL